jgi:tetratricopeptide (TPR) repeat protein
VFLLLGNFANEREDSAAAMTYYEKSFVADERSPIAMNNFAFIAARQGQRLPEAEKAIDEAIRQTGSRPELLDTKAAVLIAQDRAAEARDLLRTIPVQQLDATLLFRLAECEHRLGNKSESAALLKLAFEKGLNPEKVHPLDREIFRELQQISVQ